MIINYYPSYGLNPYTGYGRMELGIAKGLQIAGVQYRLYPDDSVPTLLVGNPRLFDSPHLRATRRWAFTMSESTQPSDMLINALNNWCERVIVPCPPMIDYYRNCGVKSTLSHIGLGVDLFISAEMLEAHRPPATPFTFMTYSYGDQRKGGELAVAAFTQLFAGDEHFHLIIKAREGYQRTWLAALNNPQITVLTGYQSETEWINYLKHIHCFIFPSRGEGWGMPPRDATMLGVPAIATRWLGMWDVDQWGIPIKVNQLRPVYVEQHDVWNAPGSLWAEPDFDDLKLQMQWVVDHFTEAQAIAENGRQYLLQHYRWSHVGAQLRDLLKG